MLKFDSEAMIKELEEITHIHIKQYINFLKDKNLSETYINTILNKEAK